MRTARQARLRVSVQAAFLVSAFRCVSTVPTALSSLSSLSFRCAAERALCSAGLAGKIPGGGKIPGLGGGGGMGSSTKGKVAMAKAAKGGMSLETAATLAKAFK